MSKLKIFIAICFGFILFNTNNLTAQNNNLRYDSFWKITGVTNFSFERSLHKHFSAILGFERGMWLFGKIISYNGSHRNEKLIYNLSGWGFTPEIRYYPFIFRYPAPRGLFIGGYYTMHFLNEYYNWIDVTFTPPPYYSGYPPITQKIEMNTKAMGNNLGFCIGYKFCLWHHLTIEPLFGYANSWIKWHNPNERNRIDPEYISLAKEPYDPIRIELNIGLMFPKVKRTPAKIK